MVLSVRKGTAMKKPSIWITDLDGVVVDSVKTSDEVYIQTFRQFGLTVSAEQLRAFDGVRSPEAIARIVRELDPKGCIKVEDVRRVRREILHTIEVTTATPYPGAIRFLKEQARARFRLLGLNTSSGLHWAGRVVEHHQLRFDVIVTGDRVAKGKPHPESYSLAISELDVVACSLDTGFRVHPDDCIITEDATAGVLAARDAGVKFIVGMTTTTTAEKLLAAGASHIVGNYQQLVNLLIG